MYRSRWSWLSFTKRTEHFGEVAIVALGLRFVAARVIARPGGLIVLHDSACTPAGRNETERLSWSERGVPWSGTP